MGYGGFQDCAAKHADPQMKDAGVMVKAEDALPLLAEAGKNPSRATAQKVAEFVRLTTGAALEEAGFFGELQKYATASKKQENKREGAAHVFGALSEDVE
eukprot:Hpha_TRINITY_DN16996_c2_g1::TRINITY_DN16996_c2_g1_i12::g.52455::m.52455